MRIDVLVIIALGKLPYWAEKRLPQVCSRRRAIAVAAPVSDGSRGARQDLVVREDAASLAHGDMVGRVEAAGGDMANDPTILPLYMDPSASQQSSINHRSCSFAIRVTSPKS